MFVKIINLFFLSCCIFAGCKKCDLNYQVVKSNLKVYPERKEFNVGDAIYFIVEAPFDNVNQRNGEIINISNTKNIQEFFINLGRMDSVTTLPGGFDNGFNYMEIIPLIAGSFRREIINGINGNIKVQFSKQNEMFKVKLMAILMSKGVYMLEHGPTSGEDGNCFLNDFSPNLINASQNEELFRAIPLNFYPSIRATHYFFKVK